MDTTKFIIIHTKPDNAITQHRIARAIKDDIWRVSPIEVVDGEYSFTIEKKGD